MVRIACKNTKCKKESQVLEGWKFCPYCGKMYEEYAVDVKKMIDAKTRRGNLFFSYLLKFYVVSALLCLAAVWYFKPPVEMMAMLITGFLLYLIAGILFIDRVLVRPKFPEIYKKK